eukprot:TRINITY_DN686_c0_g1_i3.p1 TRINITY_DN686_c0_g1~~TRINITY_DN686_c0_g1_i3.p1  ORF type:complete len:409 (-),score=33.36 TRINITY_DN686_c0_g1_i3:49-1275(-)
MIMSESFIKEHKKSIFHPSEFFGGHQQYIFEGRQALHWIMCNVLCDTLYQALQIFQQMIKYAKSHNIFVEKSPRSSIEDTSYMLSNHSPSKIIPLIVELKRRYFQDITYSNTYHTSSTLFKRLMSSNSASKRQFIEFLRKEHADENLMFHECVECYRNLSSENLLVEASRIYEDYVSNHATHQINIEGSLKNHIKQVLKQFKKNDKKIADSESVLRTLFDSAERAVYKTLQFDCFKRFSLQSKINLSNSASLVNWWLDFVEQYDYTIILLITSVEPQTESYLKEWSSLKSIIQNNRGGLVGVTNNPNSTEHISQLGLVYDVLIDEGNVIGTILKLEANINAIMCCDRSLKVLYKWYREDAEAYPFVENVIGSIREAFMDQFKKVAHVKPVKYVTLKPQMRHTKSFSFS